MSPVLLLTAFLVRRVRVSLSGEFDVSKAFTRDLFPLSSSLISPTSHLLRKQRSVWAKPVFTAVCWTPLSQSAVGRSTCMVPAGGVQDASKRLLPGKGTACLFREAADSSLLIAAWSSLAPWPVPESRCVMSPFLNRWTCHMPLRVLIQHSLTMWVNRFKASLGKKKKKGVSSLGRWVIQWKISQAPPLVSWWWTPVCPSRLCLSEVLSPCSWLHEVSSPTRSPRITLRHIQIWAKLLVFVFCLSMNLIYSNGWTGLWVAWCLRWRWCEMGVERKGCGQNLHR